MSERADLVTKLVGRVICVSAISLFVAACGTTHPNPEETAFTVSVTPDAQSAARANGVNLKRLVSASANKALALLPHQDRIEIVVQDKPDQAIPEIGIGGYTDPRGNVTISIDPSHGDLRHVLTTWIPAMVAHELHHSSRIRIGPGYGDTLGQAIVSEGLADRFSDEVFPRSPSKPWDHALTKVQEHRLWLMARALRNQPDYNHHSDWFFGADAIPRWAGYTLGYDIAGRYLAEHHQSPSDAVRTPAAEVLASFQRG